jgi:hypothetical protein
MNADELHRLLPDRDLPSDRHHHLRELFMHQIQVEAPTMPSGRRRRLVPALAVGLAAAAAVAVVGLGGPGSGGLRGPDARATDHPRTGQPALAPVARTFELAAVTASSRSYTPPRPDQWIYIKRRNLHPSAVAKAKGQAPKATYEVWIRADGKKMAEFNPLHDRVESWDQDNGYPALAALPTDPEALLSLLRKQITAPPADPRVPADGRGVPRPDMSKVDVDGVLFSRIAAILDQNLLPPDVTAALWRAAALVPGVTQAAEPVRIDGRSAIAVGRVQYGWQFEQLLVDPDTYDYVGHRSIAIKDHTYPGTDPPLTEHAGSVQFALTRLAASIVDAPGQTG